MPYKRNSPRTGRRNPLPLALAQSAKVGYGFAAKVAAQAAAMMGGKGKRKSKLGRELSAKRKNVGDLDYDWDSAEASKYLHSLPDRKLAKRLDTVNAQIVQLTKSLHNHISMRTSENENALINLEQQREAIIKARMDKSKNPSTKLIDTSNAASMSEKFHGREPKEILEVTELEDYDPALTILGDLLEIVVSDGRKEITIAFPTDDRPKLCCDGDGHNLEIIGGNQELEVDWDGTNAKFPLGYAVTIAYETDKHHLADSEGEVAQYQHEFGEGGGELPMVVYDARNQKLELVGGDYTVEDVGIKN